MKQMTVSDLKAILSGLPDDMLVAHSYEADCCSGPIQTAFIRFLFPASGVKA